MAIWNDAKRSLSQSQAPYFAHASLDVHLEQLSSRLLQAQIDRDRAVWAGPAFCCFPKCVSLDRSQPENGLGA